MPIKDHEQRKEASRRYYWKNREKRLEYSRNYYSNEKNRERARQSFREWAEANPERNKERSRVFNAERRAFLDSLKSDPCEDCKQSFPPCVMEFHHLDPGTKDKNVSKFTRMSKEKILEEVAKCTVLCANCHRIRHWGNGV